MKCPRLNPKKGNENNKHIVFLTSFRLEFSSSVEEFFLKDVPENVYKFASSPMKFGELNLLTYFEVDGFLKDEPLEIKSQKTTDTFLQR